MLRPEVRKYYATAQYRRERREFIKQHGEVCTVCHRYHPRLNLAHLSHDPLDKRNRALLCPRDHALNDKNQRIAMTRRTLAKRHGQLWLTEEIEWAPHPVRTWPDHVRQIALFQETS